MEATDAERLFRAAEAGDSDEVERLLHDGTPPDGPNAYGDTPLLRARNAAVAERLIAAGADMHTIRRYGRTPLLEALEDQRLDVVDALVRAGCNLEQRDNDRTPLLRLCGMYGVSPAAVAALVRAGADIHATTAQGDTALHIASQLYAGDRWGRLGLVVRVLVAAGLAVDVRNRGRETPLFAALGDEGGDVAVVRTLLELGADVNARSSRGATPLMCSVTCFRAPELVRVLLAAGADVSACNRSGDTALSWALDHRRSWQTIVAGRRHDQVYSERERAERQADDRKKLAETREVVALLEAAMPRRVSVRAVVAPAPGPPPPPASDPLAIAQAGLARVPLTAYDEHETLVAALARITDVTPLRATLFALWAPREDRDEEWYRGSRGLVAVLRPVATDPGVIEMLTNDLAASDPGAQHRRAAAIELLGYSRSAVAARALVRLARSDPDRMYAVTRAFADLGRPEAWPTMALELAARPSQWCYGLLEALIACGGERALPLLFQMLDTEECARAVVPLLAPFARPDVDDRLASLCVHPDGAVRLQAALVLVQHRGDAGVEALVGVTHTLRDAGRHIAFDVWDRAAEALGEHPGDTIEAWDSWLEHRRPAAARFPALPPHLERLTSRSDRARSEALEALHLGRDPAHLTALMLAEQLHVEWGVGNRVPTDWDSWSTIIPLDVLIERESRLGPWLDTERARLPPQIVPDILAVIPAGGVQAAMALVDRHDPGFRLALTDEELAQLRAEEAAILAG